MTNFIKAALFGLLAIAPMATPNTAQAAPANIGVCDVVQTRLGGEGGRAFTAQAPTTIALRHGAFVDQLKLNGQSHGGNGGGQSATVKFGPGEYINRMIVRHGDFIDRIDFSTNKGRGVAGGGNGGRVTVLDNIRVLAIGGRSGKFLDQVEITYCRNYH